MASTLAVGDQFEILTRSKTRVGNMRLITYMRPRPRIRMRAGEVATPSNAEILAALDASTLQ